jgi:hypothetical protein
VLSDEAKEVGHGLADDAWGGDAPLHGESLPGARLPISHNADVEAVDGALHEGLHLGVYILLAGL